jgi:hypothetical protein
MKMVVLGEDESFNELTGGKDHLEWIRVPNVDAFKEHEDAAAFFNLNEDAWLLKYKTASTPVFINSVVHPNDKKNNCIRINGWNGFLEKDTWEIAGQVDAKTEMILSAIHKKCILTADEPGFISARIIAMIINEAFFALGEEVSSKKEMDIAMKLGTNYPYGPFEWGEKIGLKNIYALLLKLSLNDSRYTPAPSLINSINGQ